MARLLMRGLPIALAAGFVIAALVFLRQRAQVVSAHAPIRVLSYSAFLNSWGPGPEIARRFQEETGTPIEFHDAGDGGLLLKKLELFPVDLVLGFDQATLLEAETSRAWRDLSGVAPAEAKWSRPRFLAFDWAPLAFVYRQGEIDPPKALKELLDSRFKGKIAIQDPRTSTPGLQFLLWVLDEMGVEAGFEFLAKLKANLHSVSGSWSMAYGLFTKKQAGLAFSYLTSPVYHWTEEKDQTYQAAIFESGHPVQIEYFAVPESCSNCAGAESLARFLMKTETQRLISEKNYMFPAIDTARSEPFSTLPEVPTLDPLRFVELMKKKDELFERWQSLGL